MNIKETQACKVDKILKALLFWGLTAQESITERDDLIQYRRLRLLMTKYSNGSGEVDYQ